jgi:tRNA threonylcarbamoyladenosine biosynthesis protein TsaE
MFCTFVRSPEEMLKFGAHIGRHLFDGIVIGLIGPLGAGKTTLARGIAEGMDLNEGYVVSSPTYTIMQVYPCSKLELYHLDLYRISGTEDLDSTGYRDAAGRGKVLLVEWPDKVPSVLPVENLQIRIRYAEDGREVSLVAAGSRYQKLVKKIMGSGAWRFVPGSVDTEQCRC